MAKLRRGMFRLVVVGEICSGKSTFINALLGEADLLPTNDATSTVFKIVYGEKRRCRVFFLPRDPAKPDNVRPPTDIEIIGLADYGTEDGNPNNERGVDFIAVELPNPLLKQGLAIIDTPGLGGLCPRCAPVTWRCLPDADALFFVHDAVDHLISAKEIKDLARMREMISDVSFIQTKIDLAFEDDWRQWRDRNLAVISEQMGLPVESIRYFPVSSKLTNIADKMNSSQRLECSGFQPLLLSLSAKLSGSP